MTNVTKSIDINSQGSFVVTTHSGSRYVFDMSDKTVIRHPHDESDWHGDISRGTKHEILTITSCEVGTRLAIVFKQDIFGPNKAEFLLSTPIDKIERITD